MLLVIGLAVLVSVLFNRLIIEIRKKKVQFHIFADDAKVEI